MRTALLVIWTAALCALLFSVTARTEAAARANVRFLDPPPLTQLDTRMLDILTLGHRTLYDDLLHVWMIQVLVDPRVRTVKPEDLQAFVLNATRHRPRIESLYMLSCFVLATDLARADLCEKITLDGLKAFPGSWRIPVTQGFIEAQVMKNPKTAALYYGIAASRAEAPEFLKKLTQNLVEKNELSPEELRETLEKTIEGNGPEASAGRTRFGEILQKSGQSGGPP